MKEAVDIFLSVICAGSFCAVCLMVARYIDAATEHKKAQSRKERCIGNELIASTALIEAKTRSINNEVIP